MTQLELAEVAVLDIPRLREENAALLRAVEDAPSFLRRIEQRAYARGYADGQRSITTTIEIAKWRGEDLNQARLF